jgi:protocatechuate 3,4-dioxygenase beta subunit
MKINNVLPFIMLLIAGLVVVGCGVLGEGAAETDTQPNEAAAEAIEQPEVAEPTLTITETVAGPNEAAAEATERPEAAEPDGATTEPTTATAEPVATEELDGEETPPVEDEEVAAPEFEPIEVTYFTPSQQEGPYYPVEKPADRDSDLVTFEGAPAAPAGEVLVLSGVVYDAGGRRVENAVVEIWQTDWSGVYLHPDDPGTGERDRNFQFYGEAVTGADGVYGFRTILPGLYEPRPRHIHVKVRLDGDVVLTTQFYFGNEVSLDGEEANLVVDIAPAEDDDGNPIWVGERDVVLRNGG